MQQNGHAMGCLNPRRDVTTGKLEIPARFRLRERSLEGERQREKERKEDLRSRFTRILPSVSLVSLNSSSPFTLSFYLFFFLHFVFHFPWVASLSLHHPAFFVSFFFIYLLLFLPLVFFSPSLSLSLSLFLFSLLFPRLQEFAS